MEKFTNLGNSSVKKVDEDFNKEIFMQDIGSIREKYGENYIRSKAMKEIPLETRNMIRDIIVNLKDLFESGLMDSALNTIVTDYLAIAKDLKGGMILKIVMDILERYGWDVNNFVMPPDRLSLAYDLDQVLDQIAIYQMKNL